MRIIIVAEHASTQFGGEALIPLQYFRLLRARHFDVHLVVHARTAPELTERFARDRDRIYFVNDTVFNRILAQCSRYLPQRIGDVTALFLSHLLTQARQRRVVRDLVKRHNIDVVHEPIPVSPRFPSLMWGVGAPVVIGPLNGGMDYPEAFRGQQRFGIRLAVAAGRYLANLANVLIPGKRCASIVLVANRRTREALPRGITGHVVDLVENGVDFSVWRRSAGWAAPGRTVRFVFVGRLVDWKAVDVVLEAVSRIHLLVPIALEIIGEGPMRRQWEDLTDRLNLRSVVRFAGWLSQEDCARRLEESDVFVLPSLLECGGAVVLEAMAMGLPVIATAWGGPTDYLDDSCGTLVSPDSREALVAGFAAAMKTLAESAELRHRLGQAGYERARALFGWDRKIDDILAIYALAVQDYAPTPRELPVSRDLPRDKATLLTSAPIAPGAVSGDNRRAVEVTNGTGE